MKKNKEKNETKIFSFKEMLKAFLVYGSPFIFLFLINLFYNGINQGVWIPTVLQKGMIIEIIIIYSLVFFIWGLVKKWSNTITIVGSLLLLLSIVNQVKFSFTEEPVVFSDLLFLSDTGEIMGIVQGELWNTIKQFIIPVIIEIIIFVTIIVFVRKISRDIISGNLIRRATLSITFALVLILLFLPIQPFNDFIESKIYTVDKRRDFNRNTTNEEYYCYYGLVGGLYGNLLENRILEPDGFNEEIIDEALKSSKENTEKSLGKPNIIVVFSESFWDVDQLDEVEYNMPVTPNFNALKSEGLFFNMITPSYGGISANVEYEFLTGSNIMFFNYSYIPYMQLYKNSTYYGRPSLINELKKNGYRTHIATCASPKLFSCGRFYKYLQVDDVEFISEVEDQYKKGLYVSDEYITDKIIDVFNKKEKDERLFYMTLTMQSHMPYSKDKYDNYDVWITRSELSDKDNDILTSYAQGIYDADKQLGRLYEYIKTLEEPTIIVFYGDHLPFLNNGRGSTIDVLKYFNTDDEILNIYRQYNTQGLVLANFEFNKNEESTSYLGPDLLGAYILNNMDIQISDYYKWLYETRKTIGAANYWVTIDNEGNLYDTYKLDGKYKDLYTLRKNIEYKLFVK